MLAKYDRLKNGGVNPFIDPAGYKVRSPFLQTIE